MEWVILIPIALMLLICPLMMLGMAVMSVGMVRNWLRGRRAEGEHAGHNGHGMMMCMGHGGSRQETGDTGHGRTHPSLIEELRAERARLDELIARAEKEGVG